VKDYPPSRRRFGQNFLVDRRTVERLVEAFAPAEGEPVVEIGPGEGALTLPLLERGARLLAVEIDPRLAAALEERLGERARVVRGDALELDLDELALELAGPEERIRLLGNLPYNVATAILRRLLAAHRYRGAQILVQDEVADRLTAGPCTSAYGPLAVLCSLRGGARRLFRVGSAAFRPRPRVVSAAVRLETHAEAPLAPTQLPALEALLHRGFAERRKTLVNNLARAGLARPAVESALEALGQPPAVRAEALPPAAWLSLLRTLGLPARDASP
jgi:16S rRNA (adenine1518-N6/adenine1519-N6)-dimethyltransferase